MNKTLIWAKTLALQPENCSLRQATSMYCKIFVWGSDWHCLEHGFDWLSIQLSCSLWVNIKRSKCITDLPSVALHLQESAFHIHTNEKQKGGKGLRGLTFIMWLDTTQSVVGEAYSASAEVYCIFLIWERLTTQKSESYLLSQARAVMPEGWWIRLLALFIMSVNGMV